MKKIARILTAAVAVAGSVMGLAPAAQAAPGNTVLLGDSYFANTTLNQIIDAKRSGARKCIHGKFRVATELQRLTGAHVDDYSCNGKELYLGREPLEARLDQAIRDGKLNRNTRNVPIMVGANDTYRTLDPINNQAAARSYDRLANKIKRVAPNARIQFVSYPHLTNDRAGLCLIRPNGLPPIEAPFPIVKEAERQLWRQANDAAKRNGGVFVDLHRSTHGHDTCQPGGKAWVAGVFDNQTPRYNLTLHMSHDGVTNAAKQIGAALK